VWTRIGLDWVGLVTNFSHWVGLDWVQIANFNCKMIVRLCGVCGTFNDIISSVCDKINMH